MGGTKRGFVGHFEPTGAFTLDTPGGLRQAPRSRKVPLIDFRVPISSSCTSDPFTADGTQCPGGAPDAPFFVFTRAGDTQALFAQAAGPCVVIVGCTATVTVSGPAATIRAALGTPAPVGILVRRRSGRHLRTVGKVPLGRRHRGRLRIRWNLRVHGRRLARGRYAVTLRAFDRRRRRVIATSSPVVVRIRR